MNEKWRVGVGLGAGRENSYMLGILDTENRAKGDVVDSLA